MCLAIPGRVIEIKKMEAVVAYPKEKRTVLMGEKGIKVGDYVLVQMGIIVKKISEEEAASMMKVWKEIEKNNNDRN